MSIFIFDGQSFFSKYSVPMILVLNDERCDTAGRTLSHCLSLEFGKSSLNIANIEDFIYALENKSPAIIILPEIKGETNYYPKYLGERGKSLIHDHVCNGAMYAGFCAGAYNACSVNRYSSPSGIKKHREAPDLLALTAVEAKGSLPGFGTKMNSATHVEGGHTCEQVPIVIYQDGKIPINTSVWYENGPYFHIGQNDIPKDATILARYVLNTKYPAAVFIEKKGKGKILLSGVLPHLTTKTFKPDHPLWAMIKAEMKQHIVDFEALRMLQRTP